MKKLTSVFLVILFISGTSLIAQTKAPVRTEFPADVSIINAQLDVFKNDVHNQVQITDLDIEKFDRISVIDKQGTVLIKKTVNTSIANMDFSQLEDGVYLLGLWSSTNMREKTIKFIIRR
ncbi:MAG: T9SS type A sorting domain-containing protein [Chitinophagaceae bacterium]